MDQAKRQLESAAIVRIARETAEQALDPPPTQPLSPVYFAIAVMLYRNWLCFQLLLLARLELLQAGERARRLASPSFDEELLEDLARYVVSLRSRTPRRYFGDNHFCGGAIVAPRFVLTAAHCVMNKNKVVLRSRVILVVAGTPNRLRWTRETARVPVSRIFVPENFVISNTDNVALLKLRFGLPADNRAVAVLQLPSQPPVVGRRYQVLGWGQLYQGGFLASQLLLVEVELQRRDTCEHLVQPFMPDMLCAGNLNNLNLGLDESPCVGDTGSPLLLNGTIYGVVTYPLGCGRSDLPSVYTNVWLQLSWINGIVALGRGTACRSALLLVHLLRLYLLMHM